MLNKKAGDTWIAVSVIACSIVLLVALGFGLSGRSFVPDGQKIRVRFHDVTGIQVSSQVKYAGAPAGNVSDIRMLTLEERATDRQNLVEVTLALLPDVPPVPRDAQVSIASDTLLSDKFVLISGGSTDLTPAGTTDVLQGISPTTFDQLARNTDDAIEGLRRNLGGEATENAKDLMSQLHELIKKANDLFTELRPILQNAQEVSADTKELVSESKNNIEKMLNNLDSAIAALESLAKRGDSLVRDNGKNFTQSVADLKVTSENLKVTSTYAKFLLHDLAQRPNRLIWGGGKAPMLPSERNILETRSPISTP